MAEVKDTTPVTRDDLARIAEKLREISHAAGTPDQAGDVLRAVAGALASGADSR